MMWGDSLERLAQSSRDVNSRLRYLKAQGAPSWAAVIGTAHESMERVVQHLEAALKIKNRNSPGKDIEEIIKKCETMPAEEACKGYKAEKPKKASKKKVKKKVVKEETSDIKDVKAHVRRETIVLKKPKKNNGPVVRDARRMDLMKPWYVEFYGEKVFFNNRTVARAYCVKLKAADLVEPKFKDERENGLGWSIEMLGEKAYFAKRDEARAYARKIRELNLVQTVS